MKLLAFSDVHLDSKFGWATPEVARRQRLRLREAVADTMRPARNGSIDAVLIAGDLYERDRVSGGTIHFLQETFEDARVPIYIAPGNHDCADQESAYLRNAWPGNVHIFQQPTLTPQPLTDGVMLWGAAHVMPVDTAGFFDSGFHVTGSGLHIAVFHGEERSGASYGQPQRHAPFDGAQIGAAGIAHALVGHPHAPADRKAWTRLGSLESLAFGASYGSAVVLEIENGRVVPVRLEARANTLHDLDVDLTGIATLEQARERLRARLDSARGAARIRFRGEVPPELELHAGDFTSGSDRPEGLEHLQVDLSNLGHAYDFDELRREPTVCGSFVSRVLRAGLDAELERGVLLTGLRAFDGREDLGVIDLVAVEETRDED